MRKKISIFISIFMLSLIVFAFASNAKESTQHSVNVFNHIYYGTLSTDGDTTTFTSTGPLQNPFQITGTWKETFFSGKCKITYADGTVISCLYRNGVIAKEVTTRYPDGSYDIYNCTNGSPYGLIESFSEKTAPASRDWFYLCKPVSEWKQDSITADYQELLEHPYDYLDIPIKVTGKVKKIFESRKRMYFVLEDENSNSYLCRYTDLRYDKYFFTCIKTPSIGDTYTLYGLFKNNFKGTDEYFFGHTKGYRCSDCTIIPSIISEQTMNTFIPSDSKTNNSRSAFNSIYKDDDQKNFEKLPLLDIICDDSSEQLEDTELSYDNLCSYPYYYINTSLTIKGTVIFENFDMQNAKTELLIKETETSKIYSVTCNSLVYGSFLNKSMNLSGKFIGFEKYPHLSQGVVPNYVLYPTIRVDDLKP